MPGSPQPFHIPVDRRRFLKSMALASAGFALPGYLAEALTISPSVTQGPYYPLADDIPLDDDNDLVQLNDNTSLAAGVITWLSGRVLDSSGNPIRNALVELWHADREGDYVYNAGTGRNPACDANFAGFGQFLTSSTGAYKFRTIKAGLYNGRTRHFHLGVTIPGQTSRYTTQTFWNETAVDLNGSTWSTQNSNDNIYSALTAAQKAAVLLTYTAVPGTTTGEVAATFDFVVGLTPVEPNYPASGGFLYQAELVSGPVGGNPRFKLTFPVYAGYTYEVYGNPTLADLDWRSLPFSLTQTGTIDRNRQTVSADGQLSIYVEEKAVKNFYKVSFRPAGSNTGTP